MLIINFNDKKIIEDIVKEMTKTENVYLEDIIEAVYEDIENWFENYGLHTDMTNEIVKKLKEDTNVEVIS